MSPKLDSSVIHPMNHCFWLTVTQITPRRDQRHTKPMCKFVHLQANPCQENLFRGGVRFGGPEL